MNTIHLRSRPRIVYQVEEEKYLDWSRMGMLTLISACRPEDDTRSQSTARGHDMHFALHSTTAGFLQGI